MSVRRRVASLERQFDSKFDDGYDDDAPVSVIEWFHGVRDEHTRKRLGRAGCIEAARKIREFEADLDRIRADSSAM